MAQNIVVGKKKIFTFHAPIGALPILKKILLGKKGFSFPCAKIMGEKISWLRRLSSLGTLFTIRLFGAFVGSDGHGQQYFRLSIKDWAGRESRLVLYAGVPEASKIPPVWRVWLSHGDEGLSRSGEIVVHAWQKAHIPNLTGSGAALFPPGYFLNRALGAKSKENKIWTPSD